MAGSSAKKRRIHLFLNRLKAFLGKKILSICWFMYFIGFIWVLLHPAVTVTTGELKCRGTYISENALLVGSMDAKISYEDHIIYAEKLHESFQKLPSLPLNGCQANCSSVLDWVEEELNKIGDIEVYRQTYTMTGHDGISKKRTNIYGVLRAAPLADGKESIVLVAHYRNVGKNPVDSKYSTISMSMGLLKFLLEAKWLAKDVILLLADDGPLDGTDGYSPGTEAWLRAYHADPLTNLKETLPMRAGVIRAAINLELVAKTSSINTVGILAAGMNGQLPNLDLINSAVESFRQHYVPVVLDRCQQRNAPCDDAVSRFIDGFRTILNHLLPSEYTAKSAEYLENLNGMLRFMKTLAVGPSGSHANFIRYNIDSITLSFMDGKNARKGSQITLHSILQSIELVVKSLSSIEEKLHQSFFFYVLPSTSTFVSVGEYYYPVMLAISPAIFHLFYLAVRTRGMRVAFGLVCCLAAELFGLVVLGICTALFGSDTLELTVLKQDKIELARKWMIFLGGLSIAQLLFALVVVPLLHSFPLMEGCKEIQTWLLQQHLFEDKIKRETEKNTASTTTPEQVSKENEEEETKTPLDVPELDLGWRAIKFFVMVLLVYGHFILGVVHYPMALFCAFPMTYFVTVEPASCSFWIKKNLNGIFLLITSPLVLIGGALLLHTKAFGIASYIVNGFTLMNFYSLPYLCLLYLPVHTLCVSIWNFPTHS